MNIYTHELRNEEKKEIFKIMDMIEPAKGCDKVKIKKKIESLLKNRSMQKPVLMLQSKNVERAHKAVDNMQKRYNKLLVKHIKEVNELKIR